MNNCLIVYAADGCKIRLPIFRGFDGSFVADHPARAEELSITEVRLMSEEIDLPVRFILESFPLVQEEAGIWTVLISENEYGHPQYGLEYYATEQFGEKVRDLAVMHWDHDREQMTGD
jgi:hypothetical protein